MHHIKKWRNSQEVGALPGKKECYCACTTGRNYLNWPVCVTRMALFFKRSSFYYLQICKAWNLICPSLPDKRQGAAWDNVRKGFAPEARNNGHKSYSALNSFYQGLRMGMHIGHSVIECHICTHQFRKEQASWSHAQLIHALWDKHQIIHQPHSSHSLEQVHCPVIKDQESFVIWLQCWWRMMAKLDDY